MTKKETILGALDDLCSDFLYYDRKEDEEFGLDDLELAIADNVITINELVDRFKDNLERTFSDEVINL